MARHLTARSQDGTTEGLVDYDGHLGKQKRKLTWSNSNRSEFKVNAYLGAPENYSKGLIRNTSKSETQVDIFSNLVKQWNAGTLHTKLMGTTG
ncbi:hypothetical protein HPB50_027708 [Hyalomma asiaticum]|nr:hypothetical protein HPB50_027708 [Hyalomma asiaticum]